MRKSKEASIFYDEPNMVGSARKSEDGGEEKDFNNGTGRSLE
jgi:hypothetical protein